MVVWQGQVGSSLLVFLLGGKEFAHIESSGMVPDNGEGAITSELK